MLSLNQFPRSRIHFLPYVFVAHYFLQAELCIGAAQQ